MDRAAPTFEELKLFLGYFFENYMSGKAMAPELHPLRVFEELARRSPSKARQGLKMAVNDCIEMTVMWPPERVAALDKELRANGLVMLSELRRHYSSKLKAIRKRGRIRTEVEYYLVRGSVDDTEVPADEAEDLRRLLDEFEGNSQI